MSLPAFLTATDGVPLALHAWEPEGAPRAVIQLVHGMAEHAGRYARFGEVAAKAGYAVVADDHRGHGLSAVDGRIGHTHDEDGWTQILDDLTTVRRAIDAAYPGLPVILFGHSWGSMLARGWVAQYAAGPRAARSGSCAATQNAGPAVTQNGSRDAGPDALSAEGATDSTSPRYPLAGLILMGTMASPGVVGRLGNWLARVDVAIAGPQHPSRLLEALSFGAYNGRYQDVRTINDWLSRDPVQVDLYYEDPMSGQRASAAFYRDLTHGALAVNTPEAFRAIPHDLPVLVIAGEEDPVGSWGRGVRRVAGDMRRYGVRDLTLRLYPGARHELLNEINREEVETDLLAWSDQYC